MRTCHPVRVVRTAMAVVFVLILITTAWQYLAGGGGASLASRGGDSISKIFSSLYQNSLLVEFASLLELNWCNRIIVVVVITILLNTEETLLCTLYMNKTINMLHAITDRALMLNRVLSGDC